MVSVEPLPGRPLPVLDEENAFFWRSGADGRLRMLRCADCRYFAHPPGPRCPRCLSERLAPEPLSGIASVTAFTVNHQPWSSMPVPYVVAIVALEEQPDLYLTTNIVCCAQESVSVGMPVEVAFEHHATAAGDVYLPVFTPRQDGRHSGADDR